MSDIDAVAFVMFGSFETVRYQSESAEGVQITPSSNGIYKIRNFKIEKGRFYTEAEADTGAPVAVLGYLLQKVCSGN